MRAGDGQDGDLTIDGVTIVDPRRPREPRRLSRIDIRAGRISAIAAAGRDQRAADGPVLDADGLVAVPGLVNAHDHLYSRELRDPVAGLSLAAMRRWLDARDSSETLLTMVRNSHIELAQGITTIRDLGAVHGLNTTLARLIEAELTAGPTVVASGRPIVMTGGHVWTFGREADGPWACRQAVREQAKAGARVVKIMGSGGLSHYPAEDFRALQFTDEELAATIDEAHRLGLRTAAHVFGADAVERVVALGIDSVEHGVEITDGTLAAMAERSVAYVPTLTNMERIASPAFNQRAGTPERAEVLTHGVVNPHRETFRRALEAGVLIAVGTDSLGDYTEELTRMMDLGMTVEQVLAAATINGARTCGADAGVIEPGVRADMALYEGNPMDDPSALTKPDYVICRGRIAIGPIHGVLRSGAAGS
jgi:imidazolonepropionase-like amidohydrolase